MAVCRLGKVHELRRVGAAVERQGRPGAVRTRRVRSGRRRTLLVVNQPLVLLADLWDMFSIFINMLYRQYVFVYDVLRSRNPFTNTETS